MPQTALFTSRLLIRKNMFSAATNAVDVNEAHKTSYIAPFLPTTDETKKRRVISSLPPVSISQLLDQVSRCTHTHTRTETNSTDTGLSR